MFIDDYAEITMTTKLFEKRDEILSSMSWASFDGSLKRLFPEGNEAQYLSFYMSFLKKKFTEQDALEAGSIAFDAKVKSFGTFFLRIINENIITSNDILLPEPWMPFQGTTYHYNEGAWVYVHSDGMKTLTNNPVAFGLMHR